MLRLTLTLIPQGNERRARVLGAVEIANDGTGDEAIGNYEARMRGVLHRDVDVRGVDRSRGPWWLVLAALRSLLGE